MRTIVIAWTENTALVDTGRIERRNGNYFPTFDVAPEGKACIWLNRGKRADLRKAIAWAKQEGKQVVVLPTAERDPLGVARAIALARRIK